MRQTVLAISLCVILVTFAGGSSAAIIRAQQAVPTLITLAPHEAVEVNSTACDLTVTHAEHDAVGVACGPLYTPVPTATPAPPTATPVPPTATPGPVAVVEGVNVCTDHDATKWHPLVKRDANNAITCTYGHEHHDDPNAVNDIFGAPAAWYSGTQEISYPWQTSSTLGLENHVKHEGYKWHVQRDQPCRPHGDAAWTGCFIAWRVQVHSLGTASDATTRYHSYSMEALVEHNGVRGIVRHGGWIDVGHLALIVDGGNPKICPPLTSNPETFICGRNNTRHHSSANVPAGHTAHNSFTASWYANHQVTGLSTTFEEWGPIDYANPANQLFFTGTRTGNNSMGHMGNMSVDMRSSVWNPHTQGGLVTFTGYTDRNGAIVASGCAAPGVDCVPLRLNGVPKVAHLWNAGVQGDSVNYIDHDVMSPSTGKSLIRFPN